MTGANVDATFVSRLSEVGIPLIMLSVVFGFFVAVLIYQRVENLMRALRERDDLRRQVHDLSAGQAELKRQILESDEDLNASCRRYEEMAAQYHDAQGDLESQERSFAHERNHWQRRLIELECERDEWKARAEGLSQSRDEVKTSLEDMTAQKVYFEGEAGNLREVRKGLEYEADTLRAQLHCVIAERDEAIAERGRIEDSYRKALEKHEQAEDHLRAGLAPVRSFQDTAIEFYEDGERGEFGR
jgi:chromosome segregation ATPase